MRILFVLLILCAGFLSRPAMAATDSVIYNAAMETLDGSRFMLHDVEEPVILLHFWATWCAPCIVEFPEIIELLKAMDGKVALVAVSLDYKTQPLTKFVREHDHPDLPIYWVRDKDFSLAYKKFNTSQVPETFIIDAQRRLRGKIVGGYDWAGDDIFQQLTLLRTGTKSDQTVKRKTSR